VDSSIRKVLLALEPKRLEIVNLERDFLELIKKYDVRGKKKNYSQSLSDHLARKLVVDLSTSFPGLLAGETKAGGRAGPVKVDVRLHTQYGMALGISIKSINFRDLATGRFTKNIVRNDKELRAEAAELHQYQPYAVLCGLVLLPQEARLDGKSGRSSFVHAMDKFRHRVGRTDTSRDNDLFEQLYVGTYSLACDNFGELALHDVGTYSGGNALPPSCGWHDFLEATRAAYERRHRVVVPRPRGSLRDSDLSRDEDV
jgi:hypothetical protein